MTQQQKQRERPKQASRNIGEIVISAIDLLLGLPLALLVIVMMLEPTNSHDFVGWLMIAPLILIALGLVLSGLLLWARQNRLARAFQWLATLGGILLGAALAYSVLKAPRPGLSWQLGLVVGFLLALVLLVALSRWLRNMDED